MIGAFGTAMATQAARCGHQVNIYLRNKAQAGYMNEARINPKTLNEFELHPNITAEIDLEKALYGSSLVILSLPAQLTPHWLHTNKQYIDPHVILCNTAKGLYLKEQKLLSVAVRDALARDQPYAQLSGNNDILIIPNYLFSYIYSILFSFTYLSTYIMYPR
jgi:glycerol-3-phosphate dehydrogenase (NAD(P)+)